MRVAPPVAVTGAERATLQRWARSRILPARQVLRAKIILLAAAGTLNKVIGATLQTDAQTVNRWRTRFAAQGLAALSTEARRGGRPPHARERWAAVIIQKTTQEKPPHATQWSTRSLARALGTSHAMVQRVWKAAGLQPHRVKTFKLSTDPLFVEKLLDVVGLYLNPPEHALVLCADEKSQIQALDRTQPGLPLKKGRCGTMTHDYKRHGTTTLFAALEIAEGKLIGTCMNKHRHQEWLRFLRLIDRETPRKLALHLIVDNYRTHKHERVQRWLAKHPRFHIHFIPTSSSWLNLIERWFRDLTEKRIRRGVFTSVGQLVDAIMAYITAHNADPTSLTWTAKADDILAKIERARAVLYNVPSE